MPTVFTATDGRITASAVTNLQRHLDAGGIQVDTIPDPAPQPGKQTVQYYTATDGFTTTYVDLPADDPRMMASRLSAVETEVGGMRARAAAVTTTDAEAAKVRDAITGPPA